MLAYIKIGRKIHPQNDFDSNGRRFIFALRSIFYSKYVDKIIKFFDASSLRKKIIAAHPYIYEQVVRTNFFLKSTQLERINILENHFSFLEKHLTDDGIEKIYCGDGINLWSEDYNNEKLLISCSFKFMDKREGLMRLQLMLGDQSIYHVVFFIASGANENSMYIGALQGVHGGADIIKALTKHFFGYRPKNLIIHALRTFARQLSINQIYAVSNHGYYNSYLPARKCKIKTSLDQFWQETGGGICNDSRFYELPVEEPQKSLEEVVSHKRNLYRKRYAAIEAIDEMFSNNFKLYLK